MPEVATPTFLVDAACDPVMIRVEGRASFQNSASLRDFMVTMRRQERTRFVMDFQNCTSMDSTFLGVLAGAALELRKANQPVSSLVLCRVGERNLELIKNLGLHRILTVDVGPCCGGQVHAGGIALAPQAKMGELESARLVLSAHENLVAADVSNREKFQDVLAFLNGRVEQG